jgi:hypothetical protein
MGERTKGEVENRRKEESRERSIYISSDKEKKK